MTRRRVNGFPVYEEGERCEGCGVVQRQSAADKENGDPAGYYLECPECGKAGCDECMPSGRGVVCPECEEASAMARAAEARDVASWKIGGE